MLNYTIIGGATILTNKYLSISGHNKQFAIISSRAYMVKYMHITSKYLDNSDFENT